MRIPSPAIVLPLALALISTTAVGTGAQPVGAVFATDYVTVAFVAGIELSAPWTIHLPGEPVYHDAVAVWHDNLLYVVNRGGADNIQVLDPAQGFATVRQFSLGLGRNIQDIGFPDDGTAWVSCYDTTELLHIDPENGEILHVISTALFADADGLPETGWLLVRNGRVYLTCQRLDRDNWYAPVGDSYLLVLDIASRTWVDSDSSTPGTQGIRLAAPNPYARPVPDAGRLLLACVGFYGMQDGGVDVVDPGTLTSLGLEITEAELGGDLVDLELDAHGRYVIVADPTWVTDVKTYTPGGGVTTLHNGAEYDHADIACDGDFQLFVADRRLTNPGVRVFDTVSGVQLTSGPISCGLGPALIVLPSAGGTVGAPAIPSAALTMARPWPNPANPATRVAVTTAPGATVELRVVDLRGRLVRRDKIITDATGHGAWTFDGRDERGRLAPSGMYRCVAQTATGFAANSLTLVR